MNSNLLWAEVDLAAVAHNTRQLRRIVRPEALLMAAVKADAYGHGSVAVSKTALAHGADALGVARVEEGVLLRKAGIGCPILVFGYSLPVSANLLIDYDLTATVYDLKTAHLLAEAAAVRGKTLKIHIKIDTGMGRLGMLSSADDDNRAEEASNRRTIAEIKTIASLAGLELEGIFTHFAGSDCRDKTFTELQFNRFMRLVDELKQAGIVFRLRHAANSGAILDLPHTHLDMVRAGITLYGLYPSSEVSRDRARLLPAMSLKARVIHVKTIPPGYPVSYNSTWKSRTQTAIATVPVGYADGYFRALSNRGEMLVHGCRAPIVGRVCMDLTLLDVGHVPDVKIGDEVVIFGRQKDASLSVDEVAALLNTINYEIVSSLTHRVAKIYLPCLK